MALTKAVRVRGELLTWSDDAGKELAAVEMLNMGVSRSTILTPAGQDTWVDTDEQLFAPRPTFARGFLP